MMVAALTLILQLGGIGPDKASACQSTLETECNIKGSGGTADVPDQCTKQDDETPVDGLPSDLEQEINSGGEISCETILN